MRRWLPLLLLACTTSAGAESPLSKIELKWGGRLQSDIRFRIDRKRSGDWYALQELGTGVSRNENSFKLKLEASYGRVSGVADIDFAFYGVLQQPDSFGDLFRREKLDPYRLRAHSAYIEITDLGLRGLDLRVGQQIVSWGKGDQFNPTNTLNANDYDDPLLFGNQLANAMVKLDYNPRGNFSLSAVLVPVFKPALLPASAAMAISSPERLPIVDDALRWRLQAEQALVKALGYPAVVTQARPVMPDVSLANMQFAFRVAGSLGDHDVALSFYQGRSDMPQPYANYSRLKIDASCRPAGSPIAGPDCIKGRVETETYLTYPRMQVIGLNAAGQLDVLRWISRSLKPLGYRVEVGLFLPQEASLALLQDPLDFGFMQLPGGEYAYGLGAAARPRTVASTPFAKWVVGLDYTFNRYLYVNAQWVHGFPDEFGAGDFISPGVSVRGGSAEGALASLLSCALSSAGALRGETCAVEHLRPRLGDYLVLGIDVKLLNDRALARLFFIWDLIGVYEERWDPAQKKRVRQHHQPFSTRGFSAIVFPELTYNFGFGLELSAGALLKLGQSYTKFGDPAAGGSEVWTRARFSY